MRSWSRMRPDPKRAIGHFREPLEGAVEPASRHGHTRLAHAPLRDQQDVLTAFPPGRELGHLVARLRADDPSAGTVVVAVADREVVLVLGLGPDPSILGDQNDAVSLLVAASFPLVPGISIPQDEQVTRLGGNKGPIYYLEAEAG